MAERTNLIVKDNPTKYIVGSIILFIISLGGIYFLLTETKEVPIQDVKEVEIPTPTIQIVIKPTQAEVLETVEISVTPTTEQMKTYENKEEGFAVTYDGKRKVVVENEKSGKRYVFSNSMGNITVHVGKTWSWISSGRVFSNDLLVGGEKSFVYEISNQKIVDVEKDENKYTIQCVHNAKIDLKNECDKFLGDFEFI